MNKRRCPTCNGKGVREIRIISTDKKESLIHRQCENCRGTGTEINHIIENNPGINAVC